MRKAFALVMSAGLGLTALAGSALADRGHGMFERADANGDGFVTKDEFAASRATFFTKLDANGDGFIDQAELDKAREAWHQRMNKPAQSDNNAQADAQGKKHHGFMQRMDKDGDGKISAAEFAAAGDQMFAKLDVNGDGKIVKDEIPHHRKHGQDAPADGAAPAQ
ncbi:MAG: EF-hand domain-containing protein [Dongiaceae bacterium]